jgi:Tol biopolymer transport system component
VRGGDDDANWPAPDHFAPDPNSATEQQQTILWSVALSASAPVKIAVGDAPAFSSQGPLAYIKDDQVWSAALDGHGSAQRLFFDRGKAGDLHWSPDAARLAFVSHREGHASSASLPVLKQINRLPLSSILHPRPATIVHHAG